MDLLNQVHRAQGIGLTRAGRATTLIHTSHRTFLTQDNCATGEGLLIVSMPNEYAGDVGYRILKSHG
jgi:hypothetical protein